MSSSQRKLYQEIDKSLKKVREGIQDFDQIFTIFEQTDPSNQAYREKLEIDINKQIKKLQKQREQIKTWMSKEDVKERDAVLRENRRNIEQRMETAKVVEKMVKLKKFSTQALANPDLAIHPKDLKKYKLIEFLQECIDELNKQREMLEGEIEHGNDDMQTEHLLERHVFNIVNLENLLKQVNTDGLDVETVEEFKDDIQYYVDNNISDPDFVEYETIYEDLGCEVFPNENGELKETTVSAVGSLEGSPVRSSRKESSLPEELQVSRTAISSPISHLPSPATEPTSPEPPRLSAAPLSVPPASSEAPSPLPAVVSAAPSPAFSPAPHSTFLSKRTQNTTTAIQTSSLSELLVKQVQDQIKNNISAISGLPPGLQFPGLVQLLQTRQDLSVASPLSPEREEKLKYSLLNSPDSLDSDFRLNKNQLSAPHPTSIFFPQEPLQFLDNTSLMTGQSPALQLLATEEDKVRGYVKIQPLAGQGAQERWCSNVTRNDHYSSLAAAKIATKFEPETLFFIFYHYQDTFQQFLSARELNIRGWKFEKNEVTWYLKSADGTWQYFDFEEDWVVKTKTNYSYYPENFEDLHFTSPL